MFKRDPHCYWCGVRVVLDAEGQPYHATVDHLYSKMHPLRPVKYAGGNDRAAVLHVLACAECNQARGKDDQQGRVFVPKLIERREMAELCSAVIAGSLYVEPEPAQKKKRRPPQQRNPQLHTKRAIMDETVRGFGWTDSFGDLRPRSWEEYVKHRPAFIGEAFYRPGKPKPPTRAPICTLGELLQHRELVRV